LIYKNIIRPVLFLFDAETVHNFVLHFFSKAKVLYPLLKFLYSPKTSKAAEIWYLKFKNRLGLAAGFDKNGIAISFWETLGFSHVEVGTVTPLPQSGNDKPRIFRLKKDEALINRLGFNSHGADRVRSNIINARKNTGKDFVIGINIGKNRDTLIKDAFNDYRICFEKLYDAADYFTINISSPNTEGLRRLHEEEHLNSLLNGIQGLNKKIAQLNSSDLKCIFLKIAPDLQEEMIRVIYDVAVKNNITGIIATNTTVDRVSLKTKISEQGGLSGKPLKAMSDQVLGKLNQLNKSGSLVLIGTGGVFKKHDFDDKIKSGAALVQIYTGLIYEGPSIIKNLLGNLTHKT
jgi:dihydroorotate dehydrogenase